MPNFYWSVGFFTHVSHVYFEQVWEMSSRTPVASARQGIFQFFTFKESEADHEPLIYHIVGPFLDEHGYLINRDVDKAEC